MSESTRDYFNKLNQIAWNEKSLKRFQDPDFQGLGKLSVLKYLQLDPSKGNVQTSQTADYSRKLVEGVILSDKDINSEIWPLESGKLQILDFACGAGKVSNYLIEQLPKNVKYSITGIDISADMVKAYNSAITANLGHAYALDLMDEACSFTEDFDVAVCSMSLHHIPDLALCIQAIAKRVKKGGWFLVMDINGDTGHSDHDAKKRGIAHRSLNTQLLRSTFENAGFGQIVVEQGFRYVFSPRVDEAAHDHHFVDFKLCIVAGKRM